MPRAEQLPPDAALRAARRQVARRHHPDVGGDVETYLRALAQLEARVADRRAQPVARRSTRGRLAANRRRLSLLLRRGRAGMPRRWPGAKRFARL